MMKPEDAEEYTQSLGQIFAGSWRQIEWADRQGVPASLGLTLKEWVQQRLGGYVRISIEKREDAAKELTAEGYSTREIGEILGVNQSTIVRDLGDANASPAPEEHAKINGVEDLGDANASPEPDEPKESPGSANGDSANAAPLDAIDPEALAARKAEVKAKEAAAELNQARWVLTVNLVEALDLLDPRPADAVSHVLEFFDKSIAAQKSGRAITSERLRDVGEYLISLSEAWT